MLAPRFWIRMPSTSGAELGVAIRVAVVPIDTTPFCKPLLLSSLRNRLSPFRFKPRVRRVGGDINHIPTHVGFALVYHAVWGNDFHLHGTVGSGRGPAVSRRNRLTPCELWWGVQGKVAQTVVLQVVKLGDLVGGGHVLSLQGRAVISRQRGVQLVG